MCLSTENDVGAWRDSLSKYNGHFTGYSKRRYASVATIWDSLWLTTRIASEEDKIAELTGFGCGTFNNVAVPFVIHGVIKNNDIIIDKIMMWNESQFTCRYHMREDDESQAILLSGHQVNGVLRRCNQSDNLLPQ